jgi:hypothetical protein
MVWRCSCDYLLFLGSCGDKRLIVIGVVLLVCGLMLVEYILFDVWLYNPVISK